MPPRSKPPMPSAMLPLSSPAVAAYTTAAPPTAPSPRPTTRAATARPRPPLTRERHDGFAGAAATGGIDGPYEAIDRLAGVRDRSQEAHRKRMDSEQCLRAR